jgi:hypothetical protein
LKIEKEQQKGAYKYKKKNESWVRIWAFLALPVIFALLHGQIITFFLGS